VIDLARQPGASTAAVALANGLNESLRRRVREHEAELLGSAATGSTSAAPAAPCFMVSSWMRVVQTVPRFRVNPLKDADAFLKTEPHG
jgi:hypothetical protein